MGAARGIAEGRGGWALELMNGFCEIYISFCAGKFHKGKVSPLAWLAAIERRRPPPLSSEVDSFVGCSRHSPAAMRAQRPAPRPAPAAPTPPTARPSAASVPVAKLTIGEPRVSPRLLASATLSASSRALSVPLQARAVVASLRHRRASTNAELPAHGLTSSSIQQSREQVRRKSFRVPARGTHGGMIAPHMVDSCVGLLPGP